MWYPAELVVRNYQPDQLEKGMLFLNILHPGTYKETYEIFSLEGIPGNEQEFISINGYPIEFSIIDNEGNELLEHSEIGWFDFGEKVDFLTEISLKEINIILNEFEGWLEIEIDDDAYDEEDLIIPVIQNDKALLKFYEEEEYDEDEEDEEEEED